MRPAHAATTDDVLEAKLVEARDQYVQAYFGQAIELADKVYAQATAPSLKARAKILIGLCFVGLSNDSQARAAFRSALESDYAVSLPTLVAPPVRMKFEEERRRFFVRPKITHTPPKLIQPNEELTLAFQADPWPQGYVATLHYRLRSPGADDTFAKSTLLELAGQRLQLTLPAALFLKDAAPGRQQTFEYYLTVSGGEHEPVPLVRSAAHPEGVTVAALPEPPLHRRWWFWMVIGGVVLAAAGTTTGLVLNQQAIDSARLGDFAVVVR